MDMNSGKGGVRRQMALKKGDAVASGNAASERGDNAQFCNRIGCNGRIKYSQNMINGSSDKAKCSRLSFSSSSGKETTKNSSQSSSLMARAKIPCNGSKRELSSQSKFDASESSQSSELELMSLSSRSRTGYRSESMKKPGIEIQKSSVSSDVRPQKVFHCKSGSRNQNVPLTSSDPSVSKSSALRPSNRSNGSLNPKCNSIPHVPPSCSSYESKAVGKNVMRTKSVMGESSLSRKGRKTNAASPLDGHTSASSSSGRSTSHSADNSRAASVWTRRSTSLNTRMRFSSRQHGRNNSSPIDHSVGFQISDNDVPFNGDGHNSSPPPISASLSSSASRLSGLSPQSGDDPSIRIPLTPSEHSFTRTINRDTLLRYNIDGIAEVLLALERLEQAEELTDEQVLALETSLFLGGLNLYDQHRDMRLDIDNMSYEELIALEERMGSVSTALSEESLTKCLTKSFYHGTPSEVRDLEVGEDGDETKCSICQEEYTAGDEIGKLVDCQHVYHVVCINHWLRLKNWCPICKASAEPSKESSSS